MPGNQPLKHPILLRVNAENKGEMCDSVFVSGEFFVGRFTWCVISFLINLKRDSLVRD